MQQQNEVAFWKTYLAAGREAQRVERLRCESESEEYFRNTQLLVFVADSDTVNAIQHDEDVSLPSAVFTSASSGLLQQIGEIANFSQNGAIVRLLVGVCVNIVAATLLQIFLPLILSESENNMEFILNSVAILFLIQLDDLDSVREYDVRKAGVPRASPDEEPDEEPNEETQNVEETADHSGDGEMQNDADETVGLISEAERRKQENLRVQLEYSIGQTIGQQLSRVSKQLYVELARVNERFAEIEGHLEEKHPDPSEPAEDTKESDADDDSSLV